MSRFSHVGDEVAGIEWRFGVGADGGAVDLAERNTLLGGQAGTDIELGRKDGGARAAPADFSRDDPPRRLDMAGHSGTNAPFVGLPPHAKCSRFTEENSFQRLGIGRSRDHGEERAGATFLHLDRRRVDIERPGFQQPVPRVADDFARDVIEICFQQDDAIGLAHRGLDRLSDKQPHDIRAVAKLFRPGPIANINHSHRGKWTKLVGQHLENGGPRGRGQLKLDRNIDQRNPLEQFERAGCGDRADAMCNPHAAAPCRYGTGDDPIGLEQVEPDCHADDIDDRIDRADFVKMDAVDRHAMHAGFGLGHRAEDFQREGLLTRGQPRCARNDRGDVREVAM